MCRVELLQVIHHRQRFKWSHQLVCFFFFPCWCPSSNIHGLRVDFRSIFSTTFMFQLLNLLCQIFPQAPNLSVLSSSCFPLDSFIFPSIVTSRHDVPHILYSQGGVLVLGVDPDDTVAQAAHGKNGTGGEGCARNSRPTKRSDFDQTWTFPSIPSVLTASYLPTHPCTPPHMTDYLSIHSARPVKERKKGVCGTRDPSCRKGNTGQWHTCV